MVTINGTEYEVKRLRFRKYIQLESIRQKIEKSKLPDEQTNFICDVVEMCLGVSKEICLKQDWKSIAIAYVAILTENIVAIRLPFLKFPSKKNIFPDPWEYPDRDWYSYAHMFAKEFGWSLEYIADLEIEDALKIMQEILVSQQLTREWEWNLSEKSTGYDESTKHSKHIDLPRPDWMVVVPPPPKKIKMKRSILPQGLVIKADGTRVELS